MRLQTTTGETQNLVFWKEFWYNGTKIKEVEQLHREQAC